MTDRWTDPTAPVAERVADLLGRMTTREKIAQLSGYWGVDLDSEGVAPMQDEVLAAASWEAAIADGLGQITRPFGTAPVEPAAGMARLAAQQQEVRAANRFGIPAQVHEECLTGLAAWQATVYPSPLCWAATFDPPLIERMGARIAGQMRQLGIHQGMAPVLDVVRDLRWGRVEETMGEDPFLVGLVGSAYVRGIERGGIVATPKHFAGYAASRGGRNLAPVSMGRRELADMVVLPFEMALRAGARSIMNAYTDVDGIPSAADRELLVGRLRDEMGFQGPLVADYFSVEFLHTLHRVAADLGEAAVLALTSGIDVELPSPKAYAEPLQALADAGEVPLDVLDAAVTRVLTQKCELGLLDADWAPPEPAEVDLDDPTSRALAREVARRAVVLLSNDAGVLPLRDGQRLAVVGPLADTADAMLGCYSFPRHVLSHHGGVDRGLDIPTVRKALATSHEVAFAAGGTVRDATDADLAEAAAVAAGADVCIAVVGDIAGLFGRGTSGEGCDATDLRLPGRQEELLEALLATGTPVVALLLVGRPYDLSRQVDRLAAVVCGFFPGEEGGPAVAEVLTGAVHPSGRLPVGFPGAGSAPPSTYLAPPLGRRNEVSSVDPTPLFPFGHGLGYATADWSAATAGSGREWATDGHCTVELELTNAADREVTEVVQVYLHDRWATVVRPVQQLIGAVRVDLAPGAVRRVRLDLHADLTAFSGRDGRKRVEPGAVDLRIGASSEDIRSVVELELVGPARCVGADRVLEPVITVDAPSPHHRERGTR